MLLQYLFHFIRGGRRYQANKIWRSAFLTWHFRLPPIGIFAYGNLNTHSNRVVLLARLYDIRSVFSVFLSSQP